MLADELLVLARKKRHLWPAQLAAMDLPTAYAKRASPPQDSTHLGGNQAPRTNLRTRLYTRHATSFGWEELCNRLFLYQGRSIKRRIPTALRKWRNCRFLALHGASAPLPQVRRHEPCCLATYWSTGESTQCRASKQGSHA